MDPVAFELFGQSIRWYGIIIAAAVAIAFVMVLRTAKKKDFRENDILDFFMVVVIGGIIGARTYYVIFNWSLYSGDFLKMINIRAGGLAIHGGLIGGFITGYIFSKIRKIDFYLLLDIIAPWLILGQAIGRWGNYINQEAHGGPTDLPWGIMVDGIKVHPTFLYESLWNLFVFILLLLVFDKIKRFKGELILWYLTLYSIGRFFVEGLRTDSLMLGPLRMAQVISIILIALSTVIIYVQRKKNTRLKKKKEVK